MNGLKYNLSELLGMMDQNDVQSGLLLSPPLKNGRPLPNDEIIKLCNKSNDKLFPILTVEPRPKQVQACVRMARKNKGFAKGFKILLGYFPVNAYDRVYSEVYDYAESMDLPVMFHTGDTASSSASLLHANPLGLDPLANKREGLKIVACHFGNPWLRETAELIYKHPNVYADISGLFTTGTKYTLRYLDALSRSLSEAIYFVGNADKVIFGTDYPVERISDAINFVKNLNLDRDDLTKIFSENGRKLFCL
jgi:predicted TIM-barrel fold metal-dependent hydrolase